MTAQEAVDVALAAAFPVVLIVCFSFGYLVARR